MPQRREELLLGVIKIVGRARIHLASARGEPVDGGKQRGRDVSPRRERCAGPLTCVARRGIRDDAAIKDVGSILDARDEEIHGLGRELDDRPLIVPGLSQKSAQICAGSVVEQADEILGESIKKAKLKTKTIQATKRSHQRGGEGERGASQLERGDGERRQRFQESVARDRREEGGQRGPEVRRVEGGEGTQTLAPGRSAERAVQVSAGRSEEPCVQSSCRMTHQMNGAVSGGQLIDGLSKPERTPPDGGRRVNVDGVDSNLQACFAKAFRDSLLQVAEIGVGAERFEAEESGRQEDVGRVHGLSPGKLLGVGGSPA